MRQIDSAGYEVVKKVLSAQTLQLLETYYYIKFHINQEYTLKAGNVERDQDRDIVLPFSIMSYADRITESLLALLHPTMVNATGVKNLMPAYSFVRYYHTGNWLEMHKDRPSCQYSVTLPLSKGCDTPWPIFVSRDAEQNRTSVDLDMGDILIYKGEELQHWREPYKGEFQVQAHLHYVDADDPKYAPHIFDGRPGIGYTWEDMSKKDEKKPLK